MKNIPLPTNIIFITPLINFLGILGLTYMLRSDKKEVSKLAIKREDGSEFYAEIFAKKMNQ